MENTNNNTESSERKKYWTSLLYQKSLQQFDTSIVDIVRHLVFISSILAGFLFTVVSDLVLSSSKTNDFILYIIFSCLIVSSFSLFACIVSGAIFQYLFNIQVKESLQISNQSTPDLDPKSVGDFFDLLITFRNYNFEKSRPLTHFLLGGLAFVGITFLIGIFFFILSFILIGWIRSFVFVFIAFILFVGLGVLTFFSGYKIISLYNAVQKERLDK